MSPYTFDTLSASKQLREAGMAEGVAEAVVAVFQHATSGVDLSELATKADLNELRSTMATKADIERCATKADLERFATTFELQTMRAELKADMSDLSARISDTLRIHTLIMVGGLGTLLALFTYVARQVS